MSREKIATRNDGLSTVLAAITPAHICMFICTHVVLLIRGEYEDSATPEFKRAWNRFNTVVPVLCQLLDGVRLAIEVNCFACRPAGANE